MVDCQDAESTKTRVSSPLRVDSLAVNRDNAVGLHTRLEPRRRKRKAPKVRSGCFTCKKRRVKCDEQRPNCERCIRMGVDCDGYRSDEPSKQTGTRPLAPKSDSLSLKLPIYTVHAGPRFEDVQEGRYFRVYIEEMATQIRGPFSTSLWERLIPQTSEAEPFIRHAVVAIGAMSKILKDSGKGGAGLGYDQLVKNPKYTYALQKYDKALRGMRAAIADGRQDLRKALLACLLVFCFETLNGNPGSGVANAASGLMLLHQWLLANIKQKAPFFISREWQKHNIEEDIMTALAGLDLHVMFILDVRPAPVHQFYVEGSNRFIPGMPHELSTLRSATLYWSLISRRNFHFIRIALCRGRATELAPSCSTGENDVTEDSDLHLHPPLNMFITSHFPPMEMQPESLIYREEVRRWTQASTKLFDRILECGSQEQRTVVCLMRIHALMALIMLAGAFFSTQVEYDQFLPEYKEMVELGEYVYPRLVNLSQVQSSYQFDLGVLIALYLVGVSCRDAETRNRAVELVGMHKEYREGLWDSGSAWAILVWLRDLEDDLRDANGDLPDDRRVFLSSAYLDLRDRRGILKCTQRSKHGLVFREKDVSW